MAPLFSAGLALLLAFFAFPALAQDAPQAALSPAERETAIDVLIQRIDHYVGADRKDAIVDRLARRRSHYAGLADAEAFRTAVNADLLDVSGDKHLSIWVERPPATIGGAPTDGTDGPGFSMRRLDDGVAYLDLDAFSGDPAAATALDTALASVSNAPALIVDVRDNGGGGEAVLYRLLGHLLGGRAELGSIRWRECAPPPPSEPDRCMQVAPRLERRFSDAVADPLFVGKPVAVLTSRESFSAAEALAFELQRTGRAVVIGETTKGGANPSAMMDAGPRFSVVMPLGETVFADGRASWEGVGVRPDVPVSAEAALEAARHHLSQPGPTSFRALDSLMRTLVPSRAPGGAVEVVQDGKVLFAGRYGLSDLDAEKPVRDDTVFRLASVTKSMTAALILKLQAEGRLDLSDRLSRFLPEFPGADAITIRQLLSHTAGIHDFTEVADYADRKARDHTSLEMVDWIASLRPRTDFSPGAAWRYSNSGYVILAAVIETVTRRPLAQVYAERIFEPAGMVSASFETPNEQLSTQAFGYRRTSADPGFRLADEISPTLPSAAGAARSTVHDLAQWGQALFDGRVIDIADVETLSAPAVLGDGRATRWGMLADWREGLKADYGLGLFVDVAHGRRRVFHGGDIDGFSTFILHYPDCRLTIALAFNAEEVERDKARIEQAVLGQDGVECPASNG